MDTTKDTLVNTYPCDNARTSAYCRYRDDSRKGPCNYYIARIPAGGMGGRAPLILVDLGYMQGSDANTLARLLAANADNARTDRYSDVIENLRRDNASA